MVSGVKSLFINCLLVIGSIVFVCFFLEFGARGLIYLKYGSADKGMHLNYSYEPYFVHASYDGPYHFVSPKNKNDFHIVVVGGSTAANLPEDMVIQAFLQHTDKNIRVFNLAKAGFIVNQQIISLGLYASGLSPDLIISLDGANDIVTYSKTGVVGKPYHTGFIKFSVEHPFLNMGAWFLRNSRFCNAVLKLKERGQERANVDQLDMAPLFDGYMAGLRSIATFSKGLGASYVAVLQPHVQLRQTMTAEEAALLNVQNYLYRKVFMRDAFSTLNQKMTRFFDDENILYLNGYTAFDDTDKTCFVDEVHLTPVGNEKLLSFIVNGILSSDLVDNINF